MEVARTIIEKEKKTVEQMADAGWKSEDLPAFPGVVGRFYKAVRGGKYEVDIERLVGGFYVAIYQVEGFMIPDLIGKKEEFASFTIAAVYGHLLAGLVDDGRDPEEVIAEWAGFVEANRI